MRRDNRLKAWALLGVMAFLLVGAPVCFAAAETQAPAQAATGGAKEATSAIVFSVAIVVGASCIGAGYAVGRVAAAALGAASERPEMLGRSLILVGLAEGIAIYGLIIGIMLLRMIK